MALTLLVESGWLGRMHASAKRGLRSLWQAIGRGRQPWRAAGYDRLHPVRESTACTVDFGGILCSTLDGDRQYSRAPRHLHSHRFVFVGTSSRSQGGTRRFALHLLFKPWWFCGGCRGCDNEGWLLLGQDEEAAGAGGWDEDALEDAVEDEDVKAERIAMQAGAPCGPLIRA